MQRFFVNVFLSVMDRKAASAMKKVEFTQSCGKELRKAASTMKKAFCPQALLISAEEAV